MPAQNLLAQIHIAKKDLGLTDPEYRDMLYAVTKKESSKDISDAEAGKVINHFKSLGWTARRIPHSGHEGKGRGYNWSNEKPAVKRFDEYGIRPGFATPPQLRKIHATWMTSPAVRQKTDSALRHYLLRIFKISALRFVPSGQVGKILRAIEGLTTD